MSLSSSLHITKSPTERKRINAELSTGTCNLAIGLVVGYIVWLFYLEPLVRKWQPRALVGWTRLLAGTIRDPHVGRDVLAGVVAGTLLALILTPRGLLPSLVGAPASAPLETSFAPLVGVRETIAILAAIVPNGVTNGLLVILVFALLRMLFRRTWLAIAALTLVLLGVTAIGLTPAPGRWTQIVVAILVVALILTIVVRFGLLATIVMFIVNTTLELLPLTADRSAPYFATSMWILATVMGLALFAAHAARAGQPLFTIADD